MPTIQEVIDAARAVDTKQGVRRIEVSQAQAAAEASLRESGEAETAVLDLDSAIAQVRASAAALDETEASLNQLLTDVEMALLARGWKVIQVDEAVAAVAAAILEQSEADAANIDEDAAIEDLKTKANDYVKE